MQNRKKFLTIASVKNLQEQRKPYDDEDAATLFVGIYAGSSKNLNKKEFLKRRTSTHTN